MYTYMDICAYTYVYTRIGMYTCLLICVHRSLHAHKLNGGHFSTRAETIQVSNQIESKKNSITAVSEFFDANNFKCCQNL